MKKILILTITAGNGHNSAANAMKLRLEKAGCQVKVIDLIKDFSNKLNAWTVDKGYGLAVGYLCPIYNAFYNSYLKWTYKKAPKSPVQASVSDVNGKLLKAIYEFQPDVIFGTAYYCGIALENLKRVYPLPSKNIVCMLDYVVSPFWEAGVNGVDYLTLSHEDFRDKLIEKGFKPSQLVTTGIPLKEEFYTQNDKMKSREKLGLDKNLPTILIFYGGGTWRGGYGVLKTIIKHIKKEIQIVMINGHDEKTKRKIDREMARYPKNIKIKNFGFTKDVNEIMSASDFMIGKCGGLCSTEVITKSLPLLVTKKLPMQEVYNSRFLESKGFAKTFKNKKDLISKVNDFLNNPEKLSQMSKNSEKLNMNGNENIFNLIMSQPRADYSKVDMNINFDEVNKKVKKERTLEYKRRKKNKA